MGTKKDPPIRNLGIDFLCFGKPKVSKSTIKSSKIKALSPRDTIPKNVSKKLSPDGMSGKGGGKVGESTGLSRKSVPQNVALTRVSFPLQPHVATSLQSFFRKGDQTGAALLGRAWKKGGGCRSTHDRCRLQSPGTWQQSLVCAASGP